MWITNVTKYTYRHKKEVYIEMCLLDLGSVAVIKVLAQLHIGCIKINGI